jgi:hypothetical protein
MKKILVLAFVVTLATLSSMAQGVVNANNIGTGVFITIQDTTGVINSGAAVKIGTPATTAGFTGAGPGQVAIEMFAAPTGTSLSALEATTPLFNGFNSPSTLGSQQGCVAPNGVFTLPTQAGLDGSALVEFIFFGSVTVGGHVYSGYSTEGLIQPLTASQAAGGSTPPTIWGTASGTGITSMNLITPVPEPTTIVLGGLGAAALLYFRRRK